MTTGRDIYASKYAVDLDNQAKWLRYGAEFKVKSVEELCRRRNFTPSSVIEVGAGTGAVISELRRRGLGSTHMAIDYSAEALAHLRKADPNIETIHGDVTNMAMKLTCDLVICTHVLEHLEFPDKALDGIKEGIAAEYYLFEVPLEDLPLGRLRNSGKYRRENPAGHVQFYSPASFRALISRHYTILDERIYFPHFSSEAFDFTTRNTKRLKQCSKFLTQRICPMLFGPLWTKFWYAHMAVVAQRGTS